MKVLWVLVLNILFYSLLDPALSIVAVLSPRPPSRPVFSIASVPAPPSKTNKIKKTKQLFEIKTFQQKVFWGKKTFYYFGMGEKM